eukprot:1157298-Pelagomonas_calceolata.AAC.28
MLAAVTPASRPGTASKVCRPDLQSERPTILLVRGPVVQWSCWSCWSVVWAGTGEVTFAAWPVTTSKFCRPGFRSQKAANLLVSGLSKYGWQDAHRHTRLDDAMPKHTNG